MNLKNNRGITLVALMITIVVMMIIAGITVYSGSRAIKQAQLEDVKTNMLLIQAEMKNYVEQAKFENKDTINGVTINGVTLTIESADGAKNGNGAEVNGYYRINNDMSEFNLKNIENQEKYLISFDIEKIMVNVYYLSGITDSNGTTYYELSDMQE